MPFDEALKLRVKRRAHFQCCLCKAFGVQVYHIEPEALGGTDSEDNAAPLCPSCHDIYGANPVKRKAIREARDFWYEICEQRYKPAELGMLEQLYERIDRTPTKADLSATVSAAFQQIQAMLKERMAPSNVTIVQARQAAAIATMSVVSSISAIPLGTQGHISTGDIFGVTGMADSNAQSSATKPSVAETKKPVP